MSLDISNFSLFTKKFSRIYLQDIKTDKYLVIIPLLTIITRLVIFLFIPFTYEDAYITFRYAENFANGFGLVYNIGENVYGTTTPLYALILASFYYAGISCVVSSLIINLISEAITSLIVYKILKDYSKNLSAVFVSLLYVFSPSNISWSIQGMETVFFTALIAIAFYSLYRKNYFFALLFAFLSAITRIDGLSVVFIVSVFTAYEKRIASFRIILVPFLMFIVWLLFLYSYYGNFLPNSMLAKLILYSGHNPSIFPGLNLILSKYLLAGYYTSSIVSLLFMVGVFLSATRIHSLLPLSTWFFVYYGALIFSRTSIHGWYLIPPLFVFTILSGIGIIFLFNKILLLLKSRARTLNTILLFSILIFSSLMLVIKVKQIHFEWLYERNVRIPVGQYLNLHTPENSTVFLEPIGVIGYFSERYIYDDAALISPIFLEINRLPYNEVSRYKKIDLVKPDYLVLRDKFLSQFYEKTNLVNEYSPVKKIVNPANPQDSIFSSMTIFKRIE